MTAITLAQADRLIDAILARGAELDCRPLSVIVVEPGCKVKAFKKEDGSSMIRFEMAYGKAYAVCRFATPGAKSSARSASPATPRSATRSSPPTASARSASRPTRIAPPWAAVTGSG